MITNINKLTYFRLSALSEYRSQLMGIAAILILICHANGNGVEMPAILKRLFTFGNYGVDIFLLLSGMGMYHSLEKAKTINQSIGSWYKRRFIRILVPYTLIALPYWLYVSIADNSSFVGFIENFSTLSFWTKHQGAWYVALIIPLYLLSPTIYRLCRKNVGIATMLFIIAALTMLPFISLPNNAIINNIVFALSKSPCFFVGFLTGILIKRNYKIKNLYIIVLCIITCILYKLGDIQGVAIYWILTLPIIYISTIFINFAKRIAIFNSTLVLMGTISLESYLTNIYLGDILSTLWVGSKLLAYGIIIIIGITTSIIISKLSQKIIALPQN